jgi:hypothetical protein
VDKFNKVEVHASAVSAECFEMTIDDNEIRNIVEWGVGGKAGEVTTVTIKFIADVYHDDC